MQMDRATPAASPALPRAAAAPWDVDVDDADWEFFLNLPPLVEPQPMPDAPNGS